MDKETKELIIGWFEHIEQIATDRKTLNGYVMNLSDCLAEIKSIARNSSYFVKNHC